MDDAIAQLNAVIDVFERLGANLRKERLGGSGGGLCLVRGERVLFIDLDADPATQLDRCLTALSTIPEIDLRGVIRQSADSSVPAGRSGSSAYSFSCSRKGQSQ